MKVTTLNSWMSLIIFAFVFCFAAGALAEQKLAVSGPGGGIGAAAMNFRPVVPGDLAQTVKLSPEQIQALSGAGEFFIYGPALPVSREQTRDIRALRLHQMKDVQGLSFGGTVPVDLLAAMGMGATTVNNRDAFLENIFTTFTTQSEVSSAVYGNHIVAGWNDLETALLFNSVANWAVSHNSGQTWTDSLAGLPVGVTLGSGTVTSTGGDPSIDVDPNGIFYYAALATINDGATDYSGIAVYRSTDNGNTFNLWAWLHATDAADFLDKELIAVDRNSGTVYVVLTYFDDAEAGTAIVFWNVTTGDNLFITPFGVVVQGPAPAVGPDGTVYVAYESGYQSANPSIKLRRSTDGFAAEADVLGRPLIPGGVSDASTFCGRSAIKGNIRFNEFPSLASDTRTGDLYLGYNARDPVTNFLEIFLTRSTDGGVIWSSPIIVSDRKPGDTSDRFFPWVAVTGRGTVAVLYNDRSVTPPTRGIGLVNNSWFFTAYLKQLRVSRGVLAAKGSAKKVGVESPVVVNNDFTAVCYMAEYNSVSVDRARNTNTIYLVWGDNRLGDPDIFFSRIGR